MDGRGCGGGGRGRRLPGTERRGAGRRPMGAVATERVTGRRFGGGRDGRQVLGFSALDTGEASDANGLFWATLTKSCF